MKKNKGKFQSLAEAGAMLKQLGNKLSGTNSEKPVPTPTKPTAPSVIHDNFEQEMIQKAAVAAKDQHVPTSTPSGRKGTQFEKRGTKTSKSQATKQKIKLPGFKKAWAQLRASEAATEAAKAAQAAEVKKADAQEKQALLDRNKNREAIFQKLRKVIAESTPVIEARPTAVCANTQKTCETAIERGAIAFPPALQQDDDGVIVGFDFGTSSLKLAVRQPYTAGDPVVAMPAPAELQSGSHPYLWQTVIWFEPKTGRFSLLPSQGYEAIDGFKTGIIGGHSGERVRPDLPVTRREAAIAFITLHLAHFLGWYLDELPLGPRASSNILSINIGIPVAAQDDHRSSSVFRRIVAAAHHLVPLAANLHLENVREAFQNISDELPPAYQLIPELTAAIAGYAADPTSQPGSHMLVDVGASTLDIVAFNHIRGKRISVFSAAVELFGSASLEVARNSKIADSDFKAACDQQFEHVYSEARSPERASDGFHPTFRQKPVQLVITGGGCITSVHEPFITEMTKERVLGSNPRIQPTPAGRLTSEECDASRLLLAYGLTRDVQELLDLRLPSQVPSIPSKPSKTSTYISKDMT